MIKKVIYLGKRSVYGKRFFQALEGDGFQALGVRELDNISESIKSGEVSLLIYSHSDDPNIWKICTNILETYPHLPSVYILPNDCELEKEIKPSITRKIIRPLTSIQNFMTNVNNLCGLGEQLATQSANLSDGSTQNKFAGYFTDFSLENVVQKTLQYFSQVSQCRNLYWVKFEQYKNLCDQNPTAEELSFLFNQKEMREKLLIKAFRVGSELEVAKLLGQLPNQSTGYDQVQVITEGGAGIHLVAPIIDPLSSTPLAFLVFQNLVVPELQTFIQKVQEDLSVLALHLSFSVKYQMAVNETLKDDLTGLYNQRYLKEVLSREIAVSKRKDCNFSVLFLDVDFFKKINDSMGHLVGSKTLSEIGTIITKSTRESDYVFRYGGDEFVILLSGAASKTALIVAERIRQNIEKNNFVVNDNQFNLTVSIGLATYPDNANSEEKIIQLADEAMYIGKNQSRNIVYKAS